MVEEARVSFDGTKRGAVLSALDGIAGDDLDILGLFIERVRMGAETYGTLDIENDERDPGEEAIFETIDQSYYLCWKLWKERRR